MATHLSGMALFGGMIFLTDLRILGLAMRGTPVSDVVNQFRPWKRFGLVLVASCGIMLAWSKAEFYYHNPYFWAKMTSADAGRRARPGLPQERLHQHRRARSCTGHAYQRQGGRVPLTGLVDRAGLDGTADRLLRTQAVRAGSCVLSSARIALLVAS